jgi:hypothetical protein
MSACWFAKLPDAGPCDGQLVRCHFVPKSLLKQRFKLGAVETAPGAWTAITRGTNMNFGFPVRSLNELIGDERIMEWGCGGPMGNAGHHGQFDNPAVNVLRVPRELLPLGVEEFAAELGMLPWLDRTYGELERSAA